MKRIITSIIITACAAALISACHKTPVEKKAGVPMTIQASVVAPTGTKTLYEYDTESKRPSMSSFLTGRQVAK